ncbi:MAG: outer membrane lipoprotein LolB [Silanimonas sp.]
MRTPLPLPSFFLGVRAAGLARIALLAAGCATRPLRPDGPESAPPPETTTASADAVAPPVDSPEAFAALAAREAAMDERAGWQLKGRMAVARGDDGGTLNVDWVQWGSAFTITLAAPVTGRQWRLTGTPNGATLEGLEGGPRQGADAESLLIEATGWRLPVAQMPDWVRGRRGAGPVEALAVDAEGRPVGFRQGGWTLVYRDWWPGEPPLPRRVFAETDGASVRLVVSSWNTLRLTRPLEPAEASPTGAQLPPDAE